MLMLAGRTIIRLLLEDDEKEKASQDRCWDEPEVQQPSSGAAAKGSLPAAALAGRI